MANLLALGIWTMFRQWNLDSVEVRQSRSLTTHKKTLSKGQGIDLK